MSDPQQDQISDLVVVGAGVCGSALAAQLRHLGWGGSLTLVEAGQGAGGRAASRRSRLDPGWALDHGAPFFSLSDAEPPRLLQPLQAAGRVRPWAAASAELAGEAENDTEALGQLAEDGSLCRQAGPLAGEGTLLRGWPAMADLAEGLLALAEDARQAGGPSAGAPALLRRHGRRVETLERCDRLWLLRDRDGALLACGRWLVLSGNLLAHPRSRELLGCPEVPLARANRDLGDPALQQALEAVATLRYDPRLALLLRIEAERARPWRSLPFRHLWLDAAARRRMGLERVVVQPLADGRCGVVAHARPDDLIGCGLLPASGAAPDAAEADAIAALGTALGQALANWIEPSHLPAPAERLRMHWGGAFPLPPGLDPDPMICPDSQVALGGDWIGGVGFGRVEGAWRSGEWLAQRLLPLLSPLPA